MSIGQIAALIVVYVLINAIAIAATPIKTMETGFNPIQVYKTYNVNWFGCIMLVLLAHTMFLIMAVVYWFYKLCTVGRKDEDNG